MSAKSMTASELGRDYKADYKRKLRDCLYWMRRAKDAEAKLESAWYDLEQAFKKVMKGKSQDELAWDERREHEKDLEWESIVADGDGGYYPDPGEGTESYGSIKS